MNKRTIVILGASSDRAKFGNKAVRAYLRQGYEVYPVNPKGGEIEGQTVYKSLDEVPVDRPDRISVYLPPPVVLSILSEIEKKGCDELWLNPGSESEENVAKARQLGLDPILDCSIVDIGVSPSELP